MKDFLQEQGYKRNKSIYTPPLLQLGEFTGLNYLADILPETIWIGLLQNKYGLGLGSQLALFITDTVSKLPDYKDKWLAPLSLYNKLSDEDQKFVLQAAESSNYLEYYTEAFSNIKHFYPDFPLGFLVSTPLITNEQVALSEYKDYLRSIYDRTNFESTFMQATAVDMAFQAGVFTVAPHTSLAQFDEISNFPNTELSQQVASAIRGALNQFLSPNSPLSTIDSAWKEYFWNRGLEIEKCNVD